MHLTGNTDWGWCTFCLCYSLLKTRAHALAILFCCLQTWRIDRQVIAATCYSNTSLTLLCVLWSILYCWKFYGPSIFDIQRLKQSCQNSGVNVGVSYHIYDNTADLSLSQGKVSVCLRCSLYQQARVSGLIYSPNDESDYLKPPELRSACSDTHV